MNYFSLELCQKLSSFAPGFEGHYEYVPYLITGTIEDLLRYEVRCKNEPRESLPSPYYDDVKPVPAWQAEDVLRNLNKIFTPNKTIIEKEGLHISRMLILWPDSAYQKIEEYLWEILGHSRTEECTGAHCKCMQNDCANHHYNDHKK